MHEQVHCINTECFKNWVWAKRGVNRSNSPRFTKMKNHLIQKWILKWEPPANRNTGRSLQIWRECLSLTFDFLKKAFRDGWRLKWSEVVYYNKMLTFFTNCDKSSRTIAFTAGQHYCFIIPLYSIQSLSFPCHLIEMTMYHY